jgi:hypothetical protein
MGTRNEDSYSPGRVSRATRTEEGVKATGARWRVVDINKDRDRGRNKQRAPASDHEQSETPWLACRLLPVNLTAFEPEVRGTEFHIEYGQICNRGREKGVTAFCSPAGSS